MISLIIAPVQLTIKTAIWQESLKESHNPRGAVRRVGSGATRRKSHFSEMVSIYRLAKTYFTTKD